ncbi:MAG: APC family permease [Gammaproteobacteria bacterium]|nr:APC family permease [Gammaproteobacteria bacterium]
MFKKIYRLLIGKPHNPLDQKTRNKIALSAFLAWIGLGADGLSSACYGPEQAFLSLGGHTYLAFYLAFAIAISVFIISFAYNQVVELFPSGGGGYKVATKLLGVFPGLIAGSALIVDYILTIVISIASGVAAAFSLLPYSMQFYKLIVDCGLIVVLIVLNLRGMKESIKILMPIFIGFVITHIALIIFGLTKQSSLLPSLYQSANHEVQQIWLQNGLIFLMALFIRAYSLGGATYTGLEAVSNNVHTLAEPRVTTGKWTMFYMAVSLSITAGGILFLYLLWQVKPIPGMTLNAVAFKALLGSGDFTDTILLVTLLSEAGLLFVSANTGFLGGPAVLANMAIDNWVPRRFRNLSSRLVTQNGVLMFGVSALFILLATRGHVGYILVLYSVNVFIAFSVSLIGLCRHWWQQRKEKLSNWYRLLLASIAAIICTSILIMLVITRFNEGGLVALMITGFVVFVCWRTRQYYGKVNKKFKQADKLLVPKLITKGPEEIPEFDPKAPTAVLFIGKSIGVGMHALLWIHRLFPSYFKNFIFVSVGLIDVQSYGAHQHFGVLQRRVKKILDHFVKFSHNHNTAAYAIIDYGTDPVEKLTQIAEKLYHENPNCIFFASNLVFETDNWLIRRLHNETAFAVQRKLHLQGIMMMILPMNIEATL